MTAEKPISIDGLKLSPELVQIKLPAGDPPPALMVFRKLAQQRINMLFVCLETTSGGLTGSCCILSEDLASTEAALDAMVHQLDIVPSVGALTVFPHRSRLDLLVGVLASFAESRLPVYGIASSLSTLTFCTDFARLGDAVQAVRQVAELPTDHTPFRSALRIRQV